MKTLVTRRSILQQGSALVVSFALGGALAKRSPAQGGPESTRVLDPSEVDSFLAIHADGSVTIYTSKVDVGTAIGQMAAEELGIPVDRFTIIERATAVQAAYDAV